MTNNPNQPQERIATAVGPAASVLGVPSAPGTPVSPVVGQQPQPQQQPQQTPEQPNSNVLPPLVPQQQQQQQPNFQQQVQTAAATVNSIPQVDLNALQQNLATQAPAQQQQQVVPQQQQQVQYPNTVEFQTFSNQFKEYFGLDLKDAVNNYQQTVATSQNIAQQLQNVQQQAYVDRSVSQLGQAWANDPEVQQKVQQGHTLDSVVNERLTFLRRVYKELPEATRQEVDANGIGGVTALWNTIQNNSHQRQMPTAVGQAAQQQMNTGQQYTYSQIIAMDEATFNSIGAKLLDSNNFIDDRPEAAQRRLF